MCWLARPGTLTSPRNRSGGCRATVVQLPNGTGSRVLRLKPEVVSSWPCHSSLISTPGTREAPSLRRLRGFFISGAKAAPTNSPLKLMARAAEVS
jgi:hypothetical protein